MATRPEIPDVSKLLYQVDVFWRWLEHIGVVDEVLIEVRIPVSAGESGYADLWLPPGLACGEREFEIYFPVSQGIRYGWMVDSTTEYTVEPHLFIPNSGYVERWSFGRHWVKWWMLRFTYEAYETGTIVIRAAAKLVKHDDMTRFLELMEPLARALGLTIPPKRAKPVVAYSKVIKECPVCGAKLLKVDDKIVRVGTWGRVPSHKCPVFG
jgi:hypothetical protein